MHSWSSMQVWRTSEKTFFLLPVWQGNCHLVVTVLFNIWFSPNGYYSLSHQTSLRIKASLRLGSYRWTAIKRSVMLREIIMVLRWSGYVYVQLHCIFCICIVGGAALVICGCRYIACVLDLISPWNSWPCCHRIVPVLTCWLTPFRSISLHLGPHLNPQSPLNNNPCTKFSFKSFALFLKNAFVVY